MRSLRTRMFQRAEASFSTLTSFFRGDQGDHEAALQANWMPGKEDKDNIFSCLVKPCISRTNQLRDRTCVSIIARHATMQALHKIERALQKVLSSDHVAASCYSCSIKFTAFRRRHHCRVCGQIFCHACCSVFVDGASLGKESETRCCFVFLRISAPGIIFRGNSTSHLFLLSRLPSEEPQ